MSVVFYDRKRKPVAFLDNDEIFLMNGRSVAWIEAIGGRYRIWGINGKHLGWYDNNGLVYNGRAMRIGYSKEKYELDYGKMPRVKRARPKDPIILPAFSLEDSRSDLEKFLKQGA
jgi:hypothetical protein